MNSLAPPPQLAYASLEQASAAINAHAQQESYAVAISRTRMIGNRKDGDVKAAGIRNPMQAQTRCRPTGSTQRLLSQFEHVAAALEAPVRRRQLRICQQTGHNARTCRCQATATATPVETPTPATAGTATPPPATSATTAPAATTVDLEALD